MEKSKNKPEKVFRAGTCSASIFYNEVETKDGIKNIPSVSFKNSFIDKEGKWKDTYTLSLNQIPKLITILQECYKYLLGLDEDENVQ